MPSAITLDSAFAHQVFHERHPKLFQRLQDTHPYSPAQRAALDKLLAESQDGLITLADGLFDREQWLAWDRGHFGTPWATAPFLWAESYFYRLLLEAVDYFETGVDPFAPFKAAELRSPSLDRDYGWLTEELSFDTALMASLYGNQADLGFQLLAGDSDAIHNQLVADDSAELHRYFEENGPVRVTFVLDNAGRELLSDLVFADHLLVSGRASEIVLHTKPQPYYVSDATMTDVGDCLRRLRDLPGGAGQRLHEAAAAGRLTIVTHPFHCAPLSFSDIPAGVLDGLTIFKGDLNYRRLVGDFAWDPATTFGETVSYSPYPVVALRILKSEVLVGAELAQADRIAGTHASIQFYRP